MIDPLDAARDLLVHRRAGALITGLESGDRVLLSASGEVLAGGFEVPDEVKARAVELVRRGRSGTVTTETGEFFIEAISPPPRLLVFGAGPIAEALCAMAAMVGFEVEVGDPRPAFARESRFPAAFAVKVGWPDELLAAWAPDAATYVVSLLHEARFEAELMPALLRTPARYIGALGSMRTHVARIERLSREGFSNEEIDRIHGPVGLGIGGVTPEEIAVSIVAEMVSVRRG
ncbi:MAG: XdhC family protein [Acidimicrobiia bacterium]